MTGSFPMLASYDLYRTQGQPKTTESDLDGVSVKDSPIAPETQERDTSKTYRKLIFTDPVAFRYLEDDLSTKVLARRHKLTGYELFVVEQYIVSRKHPSFTICAEVGDQSKSIIVDVLAVPHEEARWSPRLKLYLEAIASSYAREKETSMGYLMVTNLSSFPSALNIIPVPDGDVRKHREDFIVNSNLKRMKCSGRAGMSLHYPQPSTITKFHHMYRTSERIPLYSSVLEIVRYCQLALNLYGKLDAIYADGLLCDITEKAITEWWNEIGIDFHNVEPSDGIFGPTTVSALIGLLVGAFNRLREVSAPVGKDPLDISSMKRAVGHFQKTNKMDRTRRLDRATLDRLHRLTANRAEDEGTAVTRALKSTVAGLSGKGGEMIARGFGGGREKAGIAEVETLDIDRLAQLVTGRSLKWLWQGKEKGASSAGPPPDELNGRVFSTDDHGNFIWTSSSKDASADHDLISAVDPEDRERRTGRMLEVVGLNHSRHHHDHSQASHARDIKRTNSDIGSLHDPSSTMVSRKGSKEKFPALDLPLAEQPASNPKPDLIPELDRLRRPLRDRSETQRSHRQALRGIDHQDRESPSKRKVKAEISQMREELKARKYRDFSGTVRLQQPTAKGLRRSLSAIQLRGIGEGRPSRLPRHLSFSLVSDAIESTRDAETTIKQDEEDHASSLVTQSKIVKEKLQRARGLAGKITPIERALIPFTTSRVEKVEYIEADGQARLEELNNEYYQHLEEYQAMQATSTDLIAREKTSLTEALRSIELLGQKLDYELHSLASRLQEVEESVDDFEHRVVEIEASVKTLIAEEEKDQRPPWYERWLPWLRSRATQPEVKSEEEET